MAVATAETGYGRVIGSPGEWVDYVRDQHTELAVNVTADATRLAAHNQAAGYAVIDSTTHIDEASAAVAGLLQRCYGGTFPIPAFTDPGFIKGQIEDGQLTSFVLVDQASGEPVGTSSLRHLSPGEWQAAQTNGDPLGIEIARSASVPSQAKVTQLMQGRMAHLLASDDLLGSHAYVFGDSRASVSRTLPNGQVLAGGAITQHSTVKNGLTPHVLHASYTFGGPSAVHEPMIRYINMFDTEGQQAYAEQQAVYVPSSVPYLAEFSAAVMTMAGLPSNVESHSVYGGTSRGVSLTHNGLYLEGKPSNGPRAVHPVEAIAQLRRPGSAKAAMVKVPATVEHLALMQTLDQAGFSGAGVIPGTDTLVISPSGELVPYRMPHQAVFVANKPGSLANAPDMELPRYYEELPAAVAARGLWDTMRLRNAA